MSGLKFPNESEEYREARNKLLSDEIELRRQVEAVEARPRALPPGGEVPQDYLFERIGKNLMPEKVPMSELFGRHRTLILYSFMYGSEREARCPMCTHLLDSINGGARHVNQRASLYIVAKSPVAPLVAWARKRGWDDLDLISTAGNSYDADYLGNTSKLPAPLHKERVKDGQDYDETMFNVFRLIDGRVRHFWGSELTWAPMDPGQHHRSGDDVNALWGFLDMTPEGREQFMPKLTC